MAILENEVWVTISGTQSYFEKLGYVIPREKNSRGKMVTPTGTQILVNVKDLPLSSNVKVTKICDKCGKIIKGQSYNNINKCRKINGNIDLCDKCGNIKSRESRLNNPIPYENSLEFYAKNNNKEHLLLEFSETNNVRPVDISYGSNKKKLIWNCSKCGSEYKRSPNQRTSLNYGCPYCEGNFGINEVNCLATNYPEVAKEWNTDKNGDTSPYDIRKMSGKVFWWKCKNCNHEWTSSVSNRTRGGNGCPSCSMSKGETKILEFLTTNNIITETQKEFELLVGLGGKPLSYDFYLPHFNILIEFQGEQHEKFIKGLHVTKKRFNRQKEHDKRKREFALKNKIELLEIWYWDFDNIETILENKLKL